jgi:hypothetical protein
MKYCAESKAGPADAGGGKNVIALRRQRAKALLVGNCRAHIAVDRGGGARTPAIIDPTRALNLSRQPRSG